MIDVNKSVLDKIDNVFIRNLGYEVYVKRDDLLHDQLSGNKWRKLALMYNELKDSDVNRNIITFGGAFSNHLPAVAFLANQLGLASFGVVRGEIDDKENNILGLCRRYGMQLLECPRSIYKEKDQSEWFKDSFKAYTNKYIIPEGGANELGIDGCKAIVEEVQKELNFDYISIDCGTGATLAGMVRALKPEEKAIGIQVLKADDFISPYVLSKNGKDNFDKFEVFNEFHGGGYAKKDQDIIKFMQYFNDEFNIRLDPVYTAKQFYGMFELMKRKYFPKGSVIVLVHSGGMIGLKGFEKRYGIEIY